MQPSLLSRRQLFVRSAATAAGLSLSMSLLAAQRAQAKIDPVPNPSADNDLLQALLAAEYDAIKTYTAGAIIIMADASTAHSVRETVVKLAVHFQDQHKEHAAALQALITANGGAPLADNADPPAIPGSFLNKTTVSDVLKLAADKEKAAALTYARGMEQISTQTAAKLVAAIGGVESQHFVVLYLLAEGLVSATPKTNSDVALLVPAAFLVDVGLASSTNLDTLSALDALLSLDPPPP